MKRVRKNDSIIIPNYLTKGQINIQVRRNYFNWKQKYVRKIPKVPNQYYVAVNKKGDTVSEALGYGMLIMTRMTHFEQDTKPYFDGMFRYCKSHPSNNISSFMSWKQLRRRDGIMHNQKAENMASATDADLDIAYSLLNAHRLWGSSGEINYKKEALKIISSIMDYLVNKEEWTVKLGDWVQNDKYETASRTSDWMIGYFYLFYLETGDYRWKRFMEKILERISFFQSNYSKETGLLPDFVWKQKGEWEPVNPPFLEGIHDSDYYYNACRIPWRLAEGYYITRNIKLKEQLEKMNKWIRKTTVQDASKIVAGYTLNGVPIATYSDLAFIAPFAVSASVDRDNQGWLNELWGKMTEEEYLDGDECNYYSDSLQLLSMILIVLPSKVL